MTSAENPAKDLLAIKQLFDQCVAVACDQRNDFLTKSHCTDAQIAQVKRMLTVADETQHSGQDIQIINRQMQDFSQKLEQGQQLDNYQIEKEIGRGGMGIVFLAHRADGSYEQKVAIKITPSFASQQELQRFHLERQILAQLQHPNIAMLLDGGSTPDNRPYLVMEYVEGESISRYAATHTLTLKQRLILFSDVCDAVSFAHSCLIVHRDIKPENVLVTQEGKVKLLDFGVSKILQSDQPSTKTTLQQGLTLSYASPEQVKGETTTTATDVYGLGALLYELLAGQVPHHLNNASNEEIIQHICLTEPVRPSKTVKSTNHPIQHQTLKGDLDNITNKALRKEPLRRYASVRDLSLDIDRYLKGQTVLATPAGFAYKVSKFINRHPAATGLAGALVVALLGGLMISIDLTRQLTVEREQLTEERDRLVLTQQQLQQEAQTSKQVINLLTDMFNAASPNNARGKDISVTKLISTAVEQTQTALTDQPKVKSRLLSTLSMVQNNIGKEKEALSLLQQALESGLLDFLY
ncbi:MAG: serine/threonine protein kinase [Psychrosphaera sp.]|nr:serine/threonine protein kinase [Psychrosphaera sp.]